MGLGVGAYLFYDASQLDERSVSPTQSQVQREQLGHDAHRRRIAGVVTVSGGAALVVTGLVKLVLRDYPLNPGCNTGVALVHSAACEAAVAVRLAKQHNRGDAMEEWLYTHQPSLTPAVVRQAAHDIGAVNDFDARYPTTVELVKGDTVLGKQLGVKSTPTFFMNGVKIEGMWTPQYFDQAIAYVGD